MSENTNTNTKKNEKPEIPQGWEYEDKKNNDLNIKQNEKKPSKYKMYPDDPTSAEQRILFLTKEPTKYYNPCSISSKMSLNCMERNNYDKSACQEFFDAYKECRKDWNKQRWSDKRKGLPWD